MIGTSEATVSISSERAVTERAQQIAAMQAELQEAMKIKSPEQRAAKINIINATFEDVVAKDSTDQTNFAQSVRDLDNSLATVELEIDSYEKLEPAEQALIDTAEAAVKKAQDEVKSAGESFFFRDRNVKAAQEAQAVAEKLLAQSKQKAEEMRQSRLMNSDIKQSTDRYIRAGHAVSDQAEVRKSSAESQISSLATLQTTTEGELTAITSSVETLRQEVSVREAGVKDATSALAEETIGTTAYVTAQNALRAAEADLSKSTDLRDKQLAELAQLKKFLEQTTTSLRTQEKMRRNLDIIIQIIETGLEKRIPLIAARLDTMKSMETLKVARAVVDVGDTIDQGNAEYAAQAANAADTFVMEYLEKDPGNIQMQRDIAAQQEANTMAMRERMRLLWDAYDSDYEVKTAA